MPVIHALLTGIDNYQNAPRLSGCVNDVDAVEAWLKTNYGDENELKIRVLTDRMEPENLPVRDNLIAAFDHFKNAADNDICLFYYCGHGANLIAPPEFHHQGTVLQALVCLDFKIEEPAKSVKGALTDKELGLLIWQITRHKPNLLFVVITDCCHSGTMTRNTGVVRGLMDTDFISPPLSDFYGFAGAGDDTGYTLVNGKCSVSLGRHLHLAAAQDDEVAREIRLPGSVVMRGAFTFAMLKLLGDEMGQLSYQQVTELSAEKIKNYFFSYAGPVQTPRLNISVNMPRYVKDYVFLNNKSIGQDNTFLVYYSKADGWCIKAGQLQSISIGDEITVDMGGGNMRSFFVTASFPNFSVIAVADALQPLNRLFRGKLTAQLKNTTLFYFDSSLPASQKLLLLNGQYIKGNHTSAVNYPEITFVDSDSFNTGKDFVLAWEKEQMVLNGPGLPLVLLDRGSLTPENACQILHTISKVSRWHSLLGFNNTTPQAKKPYKLQLQCATGLLQDSAYAYKPGLSGGLINTMDYYSKGKKPPAFRLSLQNTGEETLWVTFAYFSAGYEIQTGINFLQVQPGEKKWMYDDDIDEIKLGNEEKKTIHEYLKICISDSAGSVSLSNLFQSAVRTRSALRSGPLPNTFWAMETIGFAINPMDSAL